jgi:hypothetical protein
MSRCYIIVQRSDGKVAEIYCHSGGSVEENGVDLLNHYNTQELAEALVAPGDLSFLAANCTKPEGHSFNTPIEGYCVYYSRDGGDPIWPSQYDNMTATISDSIENCGEFGGEEFIWMDGKWWWPDKNRRDEPLIPLTRALGIDQ